MKRYTIATAGSTILAISAVVLGSLGFVLAAYRTALEIPFFNIQTVTVLNLGLLFASQRLRAPVDYETYVKQYPEFEKKERAEKNIVNAATCGLILLAVGSFFGSSSPLSWPLMVLGLVVYLSGGVILLVLGHPKSGGSLPKR